MKVAEDVAASRRERRRQEDAVRYAKVRKQAAKRKQAEEGSAPPAPSAAVGPAAASPPATRSSKVAAMALVTVLMALAWLMTLIFIADILSGNVTASNYAMRRGIGNFALGGVLISLLLTILLGSMVKDLLKTRPRSPPGNRGPQP